jgi:hypothetical protein
MSARNERRAREFALVAEGRALPTALIFTLLGLSLFISRRAMKREQDEERRAATPR